MRSRFARQPFEDGQALETAARIAIGVVLSRCSRSVRYPYVSDRIVAALVDLSIDTGDVPPIVRAQRTVRSWLRTLVGEAELVELLEHVLEAWTAATGVSFLPRFDVEEMHPLELAEAAE